MENFILKLKFTDKSIVFKKYCENHCTKKIQELYIQSVKHEVEEPSAR